MMDIGHVWTEGEIKKLQGRIRDAYAEAADDIEAKMDAFVAKFAAKDRDLREKLKAGKISRADYQGWLAGQVFQRKQWQATLDDLTATLARSNEIAMQIINETTPEAFAYNANWASYTMEKQMDAKGYDLRRVTRYKGAEVSPEESATARTAATVRFGFGLYDANTVRLLLRDEPNLLPPSRIDIPKDRKWNMANITRQIMQGIVQGEGLEQVAKRLRNVEDMNVNASLTHARTAMTGAQNAGRMESYRRAEQMGIDVQREWIATLDGHTRKLHQLLDGQRRAQDEPFEVTDRGRTYKIMYPGDPEADPRMVYNCRCTLGAYLPDSPPVNAMRRDDDPERKPIRHMTYPEWMEYKKSLMSGAEDVKITAKKPIRPDTKDATAAAKKLIRSDAVSKEINPEKQNRHVRDSGEYIPGRSYIFGDVQTAQHLVDQYHGTGVPIISNSGRWMKREVVSTDEDIGVNVNKHTGEETRTNKFTIHYSNTGTHIVPTIREV